MKAVVFHGPGRLAVETVADATLPPGGVVVRPTHVGICGSDVRTWRHGSPRIRGRQVLGHEIAGTIVASDVADLPVGIPVAVCPGAPCDTCRARVAGHSNLCPDRQVLGYDLPGGMAERLAVPAPWVRTGGVVRLDPARPAVHGALVEPLHTVLNGQDQARVGDGDTVLVLGLGPIGLLHLAAARSRGAARVLGFDPDQRRVAAAAAALPGADARAMPDGWQADARAAVGGAGFDVVIVAVGAAAALDTAVAMTAPGGRILAFAGLPPDQRAWTIDMNDVHYRQLSVVGAFGGTPAHFRRAAAWLATSDLDIDACTPGRFALDDALAAFAAAERGDGLKTVLVLD